jgi:hypothetical protein
LAVVQYLQDLSSQCSSIHLSGHYLDFYTFKIAQLDETRNVTMQIAKSLGVKINPLSAINMGLTDLLPEGKLEEWANMDAKFAGDVSVIDKAKYFLNKKPPEAKP